MAVVIDEVIGDVQQEPRGTEPLPQTTGTRAPRPEVAVDLRRLAARAARVHAD
jgi:hypothetical protein